MTNTDKSIAVVQQYFNYFQLGKMDKVLNTFHKDCLIVSVRDAQREKEQLHGTYKTNKQAKQFLKNISALFDTEDFTVEKIIGDDNFVFANGRFTHRVKSTNKIFYSDWVQRCIIKDGKIKEYRFYEDSAAFVEASKV